MNMKQAKGLLAQGKVDQVLEMARASGETRDQIKKRPRLTSDMKKRAEQARQLYQGGLSYRQIAKLMEVAASTVVRMVKGQGIYKLLDEKKE